MASIKAKIRERFFHTTRNDMLAYVILVFNVVLCFAVAFVAENSATENSTFLYIFMIPYVISIVVIRFWKDDFEDKANIDDVKNPDDYYIMVSFLRKTPVLHNGLDSEDNECVCLEKKALITILEEGLPEGKYFGVNYKIKKFRDGNVKRMPSVDEILGNGNQ